MAAGLPLSRVATRCYMIAAENIQENATSRRVPYQFFKSHAVVKEKRAANPPDASLNDLEDGQEYIDRDPVADDPH